MTNEELKALQARLNELQSYGEHPPQELAREAGGLYMQLVGEACRRNRPDLLAEDLDSGIAALIATPEPGPMSDEELKAAYVRLKEHHATLCALQGAQPSQDFLAQYMALEARLFDEVRRRDPEGWKRFDEARATAAPGTQVGFDLAGVVGRLVGAV